MRSELGVVRWFFTLVRLFLEHSMEAAPAARRCKLLSRRLQLALQELRLPAVKKVFELKHGSITGSQYRCDF